MMCSAAS